MIRWQEECSNSLAGRMATYEGVLRHFKLQIRHSVASILHTSDHRSVASRNILDTSQAHTLVEIREKASDNVASPKFAAYSEAVDKRPFLSSA